MGKEEITLLMMWLWQMWEEGKEIRVEKENSLIDIDRKPNGQYDFSSSCRNVQICDAILWKNECGNYAITLIEEIQDDTRGADCDKLKCKYKIYCNYSEQARKSYRFPRCGFSPNEFIKRIVYECKHST